MYGKHSRNLDDKRRVIIPVKFRDELGSKFFITLGLDQTLELRSSEEFSSWSNQLMKLGTYSKNARNFSRILLGNTENIELDKQGRMMIPEHFCKKTSITKEIIFIGVGNKIELWDKARHEQFENEYEAEGTLEELAEKLYESGDLR